MKIGLVLSGGGAKGAYQVGMVQSLAKHGIEVAMVSGASIGSLNGGIVASAPNIAIAAQRLNEVWALVAEEGVLEVNKKAIPRYLMMLAAAGLTGPGRVGVSLLSSIYGATDHSGILATTPLSRILDRYLSPTDLANGKNLFVSLYPYSGRLGALSDLLKGEFLQRFDTRESVFRHIQSLNEVDQREALLASAAIPVLFTPRKVEGEIYSDGGQGNYRKAQGNTPITPLLDKGLDAIIVSHLSDGSLWSADDFPDETILEVRPASRISDSSLDMLGFDGEKIQAWIDQGRADSDVLLDKLSRYAGARSSLREADATLGDKVDKHAEGLESTSLEAVMRRLRGSD
ncbi:patatin-like phospholipase family protein [Marinobacter sp. bablab_jr008]|uniref:patatin-like phospholipase family protein n=1 Tax=Marinobacter sp. bablab_jr008 TaxID=2755064 RepID=UPI0018F1B936|nr:patatin-like phospholipase family protein [Marinobacter sp. bablab_jr008]